MDSILAEVAGQVGRRDILLDLAVADQGEVHVVKGRLGDTARHPDVPRNTAGDRRGNRVHRANRTGRTLHDVEGIALGRDIQVVVVGYELIRNSDLGIDVVFEALDDVAFHADDRAKVVVGVVKLTATALDVAA